MQPVTSSSIVIPANSWPQQEPRTTTIFVNDGARKLQTHFRSKKALTTTDKSSFRAPAQQSSSSASVSYIPTPTTVTERPSSMTLGNQPTFRAPAQQPYLSASVSYIPTPTTVTERPSSMTLGNQPTFRAPAQQPYLSASVSYIPTPTTVTERPSSMTLGNQPTFRAPAQQPYLSASVSYIPTPTTVTERPSSMTLGNQPTFRAPAQQPYLSASVSYIPTLTNAAYVETLLKIGRVFSSQGQPAFGLAYFKLALSQVDPNNKLLHAEVHYEIALHLLKAREFSSALENITCGATQAAGYSNMVAKLLELSAKIFFVRNETSATGCDACNGIKILEAAIAIPSLDFTLIARITTLLNEARVIFHAHLVPRVALRTNMLIG